MGRTYDDLDGHEGYARRLRPDATLASTWTTDTALFTAYISACACGWNGTTRHHPTEDGYEAALDEWDDDHASPLVAKAVPVRICQALDDACRQIRQLADERPDAALKALSEMDRWHMVIKDRIREVNPATLARARLDRVTAELQGRRRRR